MQTPQFLDGWAPNAVVLRYALLVARIVFGLIMSAHGAQKLFGWFGGYGLTGTGEFLVQLGFRPARVFAAMAGLSETAGGLLLAFGFLGPVGPALMLSVMIVAAVTVHWHNGLFAASNGIELPLLYAAAAIVLAFTGPGLFSLDAVLGLEKLWSPTLAAVAIAVGTIGGIGNLMTRRRAVAASV
jgi:putative oxidoreductase